MVTIWHSKVNHPRFFLEELRPS